MKILLTGHLGYLGVCMFPRLAAAGHDVIGLDSDLYRGCSYGDQTLPDAGTVKDIRDITAQDLSGIVAVIHLAGLSNDPLGDLNPGLTYELNADATVRLARLAKDAGVKRFVFASTCSVYGASDEGWLTETSALNPVTPYAVSKLRAEEELDALADADFSPVFMRSATAYGLSSKIRFDLVVNNLSAWGVATGNVFLKSDGMAWRPVVHVEDIVRAFMKALVADRDLVHREIFNVGRNEDNLLVRDIATIVHETIPGSEIAFSETKSRDTRTYMVDCSKIRSIGFEPQWTVHRGVKQLVGAFQKYGIATSDFEGPRYQRVAHLQEAMADGLIDASLRRLEYAGTPDV
ncbi:NAD-dependent epimerase/dehydratase family protein [Ruegeria profundi]|uniref:NAD-dependent epimerase/dehydratase family protein n=1 Tax=Ruegeria profundi TaxID=1685378 RepID=UPI001CD3D9F9|nr:SDR family oxidoreductase [Ruegeria profundi]MCA0930683.1 SDR family oxidoreductase [Ruegeria profundi]